MAGKRKTKPSKAKDNDLAKPSKWRLQHGGFSGPIREADPETGSPVQHRRAVDTLGMMLANGTITQQMHEAGCVFRTLFRAAALDGMARDGTLVLQKDGFPGAEGYRTRVYYDADSGYTYAALVGDWPAGE